MATNDVVRARIDPHLKDEAAAILATMGLTISDFVPKSTGCNGLIRDQARRSTG